MSNVLVLMTDEHAARVTGYRDHPVVRTPNLDALAAAGTHFERAWTPSPICVPARGSFATGQWVHDIGTFHSAQAYDGRPVGWAHGVRDGGGEVTSIGKLHYRSVEDDVGHSTSLSPMWIAGGVGWTQGLDRSLEARYPESRELADDVAVGETAYTRYDRRVCEQACRWLDDAPADRPWVLFVSFVAPHYPLSAPAEFAALYDLADVPDPEVGPVEATHPVVQAGARFWSYGDHFDADLTRRARRAYYGLCSFADHLVGEVLGALDRSGQRDDTVLIYTSDHGELLGNRGLWCKSFMYEDSVAVPMLVSGPGVESGVVSPNAANLIDIAPTVAAVTGLGDYRGPGVSLLDLARPEHRARPLFSEYHDGGSITGSFAVATDRWKLVHHEGYEPELFDLDADPDELEDLGTDPGHAGPRREMEDLLRSIVDPTVANDAAFGSQAALVEQLGGWDAIAGHLRFNHTPAPVE